MDESLKKEIDEVSLDLFGKTRLEGETSGIGVNTLGLESCLVVDPDETIHRALKTVFDEIGTADFRTFFDGEAALKWLSINKPPSLIVQEWKLPKVSGHVFLQKVKDEIKLDVPLLVLSSLIKPEDVPLIREMGVANVVQKPFDKFDFLKTLVWTIQQDRQPTDQITQERKIVQLLKQNRLNDADILRNKFFQQEKLSLHRKLYIEAEFAYCKGDFAAAKDLSVEALKSGGNESVSILNVLGNSLMRLRDFPAALKCFERAQIASPKNVRRLCQIAEAHTELKHVDKADQIITEAKTIDATSEAVQETEVKKAMILGETETAKKLMSKMESISNLVSYMNNKAVALARCNQLADGITLYHKAIRAIPKQHSKSLSIVYYNLALAFARDNNLNDCLKTLNKSIEAAEKHQQEALLKKASSLKIRVEIALKSGQMVHLKEDTLQNRGDIFALINEKPESKVTAYSENMKPISNEFELSATRNIEVMDVVQAVKGDMCCRLVFMPGKEQLKTLESTFLVSVPKFARRTTATKLDTEKSDSLKKRKSE